MKTIIIFCYRLIEFRNLLTSNVIKECSKLMKVIVVVPKDNVNICKRIVGDNITIEPLNGNAKFNKRKIVSFSEKLENLLRNILSLTFAKKKTKKNCISQSFMIRAYFNSQKNLGIRRRIQARLIVLSAILLSRSLVLRKLLIVLISFFLKNKNHNNLYKKYSPNLIITGSLGLDVDGKVINEAKRMNVKTLTINQSWDRIVCKGYPVIFPDNLIVWNYQMKEDAQSFLDFHKKDIKVLGAPVWDYLFKKEGLLSKKIFFKQLRLNPKKPTVYYPLSSAFWHDELIKNLKIIKESIITNKLPTEIQFILRVHPYYWRDEKLRKALFKELDTLKKFNNIHINYNKIIGEKNSYFLKEEDQYFLKNCYHHSDLCLSVISSSMMEAIFCNTPALNFVYGTWKLPGEEIEIKDYKLHHLEHLYSYNLIKHVYNVNELIENIKNIRKLKLSKNDCKRMLEGEVPIFRGTAAKEYAKYIFNLCNIEK